ncbi:MAG: cysteine synthase family protein [Isosphaeraceae bacterium]|nr:cysteine synthase family protein [Isosphaeraceae bacterium]
MTNRTLPRLASSILDVIGGTPLMELRRIQEALGLEGRLLAKLEHLNPGSSKKDRVALEIVRRAKADGSLREGQPVVEMTSGNTGTGLAIVCRALGHPFIAVMSRGNSMERAHQMSALGAEVILIDQCPGACPGQVSGDDLMIVQEATEKIVEERGAFRAHQFEREGSVLAHELGTGPEIWEQAEGAIDVFVDIPGTCGSFTGVARALKARKSSVRAYLVEPDCAPVLAGRAMTRTSHKIQGAGYARTNLALFEPELVDGYLQVTDDDAIRHARMLSEVEGIFGGFSSGAHLSAAVDLLRGPERGATVVFLVCDSGLKYLSTDLFA